MQQDACNLGSMMQLASILMPKPSITSYMKNVLMPEDLHYTPLCPWRTLDLNMNKTRNIRIGIWISGCVHSSLTNCIFDLTVIIDESGCGDVLDTILQQETLLKSMLCVLVASWSGVTSAILAVQSSMSSEGVLRLVKDI